MLLTARTAFGRLCENKGNSGRTNCAPGIDGCLLWRWSDEVTTEQLASTDPIALQNLYGYCGLGVDPKCKGKNPARKT